MKIIFFFTAFFSLSGCQNSKQMASLQNKIDAQNEVADYVSPNKEIPLLQLNDTSFVRLKMYSTDFEFDMKYATDSNFLNAKVYDCAECYLRLKTVKALINANQSFLKLGYHIKLFDCYRPLAIQKKMWKIVPNPKYVADPSKGSIHNRGGAVDLTIVDSLNNELDMGTAFDYFGEKASHHYKELPAEILENRKLLKKIMTENNFVSFDSEWWHYNLKDASKDPVSDFKWECE